MLRFLDPPFPRFVLLLLLRLLLILSLETIFGFCVVLAGLVFFTPKASPFANLDFCCRLRISAALIFFANFSNLDLNVDSIIFPASQSLLAL